MSHRSWPWKKKHSEKVMAGTPVRTSLPDSTVNQVEEDDSKKVKYVQITEESYANLRGLEDEVKLLNEKLSSALSEIATKDVLVKQHAKVAEEAVSGWEKAEAEAIALKSQLESVMLQKLTVEDKALHLDGALKECMRQIRSVKEEGEQKLHDVVFAKTKQWEKLKEEFELKVVNLNEELLKAAAENNALSRSLQERSAVLMKISDDKSHADAQVEVMKSNIQSCEKEISSLKYELHVVSKELEIRNEEKNMSLRSAEVANKQHLEGIKKIAKLEAECQRLRGLVRKKLPGPAALAQMKLEVENLGRDYGEPRVRRSHMRNSGQHLVSPGDFSLDIVQSKETEFLTSRLMTMEEETKMLKEALSKRNNELQASRNLYSTTANKLQSLESQLQAANPQKHPETLNVAVHLETSLGLNTSNPPSLSSLSEDGFDEVASIADSSLTIPFSETSHSKKGKNHEKSSKNESSNHLELMDDFLEMEKLACLSVDSNGIDSSGNVSGLVFGRGKGKLEVEVEIALPGMENGKAPDPISNDLSGKHSRTKSMLEKLKSRIALAFESQAKEDDCSIILEEIRRIVQDVQEDLPQNSGNCVFEKTIDTGSTLPSDSKPFIENKQSIGRKLEESVSEICEFVMFFRKEVSELEGCENFVNSELIHKIDEVLISTSMTLSSHMDLGDFVIGLSCILAKARELGMKSIGIKCNEVEAYGFDCVDKVTLLENTVQHIQAEDGISNECTLVSHPSLDIEEGSLAPGLELNGGAHRYKVEFEQLKHQQEDMLIDLARCNESLEQKRFQLEEKNKLVVELRAQLTTSQKSNSLCETQLKCMVESYKALENRSEDLEAQINILRRRAENLETDLAEEKHCYDNVSAKCEGLELKCQDLEFKCKDLEASCINYQLRCKEFEEQIQRTEKGSSVAPESDKVKQEREIAAAAEKLAECQETIFLLSKQLKALRSPKDPVVPVNNERRQLSMDLQEDEPSPHKFKSRNALSQDFDRSDFENIASAIVMQGSGSGSHLDRGSAAASPRTEASATIASPTYPKHPTHRPTKSSSSSSLVITPEKHGRGFGRLFSRSKGSGK